MINHRSVGTFVYFATAVIAVLSFSLSLQSFGADAGRGKRFAGKLPKPASLAGPVTSAQSPPPNPQSPAGNKVLNDGVLQVQGSSALGGGIQNSPAPCGVTNTNATLAGQQSKQNSGAGAGIQNNQATSAVAATKQSPSTGASGLGGSPSSGRGVVIQGNGQTASGGGIQIQSNAAFGPGCGSSSNSGGLVVQGPAKADQDARSARTQIGASVATVPQSRQTRQTGLPGKTVNGTTETDRTTSLEFVKPVKDGEINAARGSGRVNNVTGTAVEGSSSVAGTSGKPKAVNGVVVVGFESGEPDKPLNEKNSAQTKALPPPTPTPTPGSRGNKPPKQ